MAARYSAQDLDFGVTASPRLARPVRLVLVLVGLLLSVGAWPLAFLFAIFAGGGHGSPFDGDAWEFAFGVAWLCVPLLVFLLGVACLACTNRIRLRIVWALAIAVPVMFAVAALFGAAGVRAQNPARVLTPPPVAPSPSQVTVLPGGAHVSIACNPVSGECVTREQQLGAPFNATEPNRSGHDQDVTNASNSERERR